MSVSSCALLSMISTIIACTTISPLFTPSLAGYAGSSPRLDRSLLSPFGVDSSIYTPFFFCMLPPPHTLARLIPPHLYSPCGCLVCLPFSKHSTRLDDVMLLMFFSFVPYIPPGVLDSILARPWTIIW
ncbi:hypothetical protein ASPTUDRAFT_908093 [Aspergillus tubingensis CBS 134.48]|uniref:Uncharacterized protein n=1 Tax=Aspergillus tubingensis (strain CBS 134.48) TaxID=767770 RepID=A0A1L9MSP3_ASPTC|nr:hypothetical protein ASPTUDRAFT_908093 [Aspergillus tubingensis CBS 134.48]